MERSIFGRELMQRSEILLANRPEHGLPAPSLEVSASGDLVNQEAHSAQRQKPLPMVDISRATTHLPEGLAKHRESTLRVYKRSS
jgi:hypothetical protein